MITYSRYCKESRKNKCARPGVNPVKIVDLYFVGAHKIDPPDNALGPRGRDPHPHGHPLVCPHPHRPQSQDPHPHDSDPSPGLGGLRGGPGSRHVRLGRDPHVLAALQF
jgi:hypothetical protein